MLDQRGKSVVLSAFLFPLRGLLDDVADAIRAGRLADEPFGIEVECSPDLEILGDTKSLLPALLAAVQNSRESIRRARGGEHTITISAERDGGYTIIRVEDTGGGFPPALLDQITSHLDRGQGEQFAGTLQPRHGVGLGIALMVRVARLHRGRVVFGNRHGQAGAWVQFTLPMQPESHTIVVDGMETSFEVLALA